MTRGVRDLRQIQFCIQPECDTSGTVIARIVGKCGIELDVGRVLPKEATGITASNIVDRMIDKYQLAQGPVTPGEEGATYEQLPWYLVMGTVGGATVGPVGNAGIGYTWTFAPAHTTIDQADTGTIIYGDNAAQWQGTCCIGQQTVLSSAFQGMWQIELDTVCRDWDNTGIDFVDIAYPTPLNTILGQMTSFYLDTTCQFAGAPTVYTQSMIDWSLTIPGFHPKFFQDGVIYWSTYGMASRSLLLEWTMEFDDDLAKAVVWEAFATGTPLYVRLQAIGGLIPGTAINFSATIDLVLQPISSTTLDERDGNDIIKFTAETVYDGVDCAVMPEWQIVIVNFDSGLPLCTT